MVWLPCRIYPFCQDLASLKLNKGPASSYISSYFIEPCDITKFQQNFNVFISVLSRIIELSLGNYLHYCLLFLFLGFDYEKFAKVKSVRRLFGNPITTIAGGRNFKKLLRTIYFSGSRADQLPVSIELAQLPKAYFSL